MPEVQGIDKLLSIIPKKRFSLFRHFSTSQYGFSNYGEEDIYLIRTDFGMATFGIDLYADIIVLSGIYRTDNITGETKIYREPYYITKNPRTTLQQANRQKFADAVAGWHLLTEEEKNQYNKRAKPLKIEGFNLYIREYMLS
jgi:hypothetical protein